MRDPKVREWAIVKALDGLGAEGRVTHTGRGVSGDPYLYSPAEKGSVETPITRSTDQLSTSDDDGEDDYPASALWTN